MDADIIICSSDKVEFRVYKIDLIRASHVFAYTFTIPQGPKATASASDGDISVVDVTEEAKVLDVLLRFCVPGALPKVEDLLCAGGLLEAVRKYEFQGYYVDYAQEQFMKLAKDHPIRAFGLACRSRSEYMARKSARLCLAYSLHSIIESTEPYEGTAATLKQLLQYRIKCTAVCVTLCQSYLVAKDLQNSFTTDQLWFLRNSYCCSMTPVVATKNNTEDNFPIQPWWKLFMDKMCTKLALNSTPEAVDLDEMWKAFCRDSKNTKSLCMACQKKVHTSLPSFVNTFKSKIEEAVSRIELDYDEL